MYMCLYVRITYIYIYIFEYKCVCGCMLSYLSRVVKRLPIKKKKKGVYS